MRCKSVASMTSETYIELLARRQDFNLKRSSGPEHPGTRRPIELEQTYHVHPHRTIRSYLLGELNFRQRQRVQASFGLVVCNPAITDIRNVERLPQQPCPHRSETILSGQ